MAEHVTLQDPFVQPAQQREADVLGMFLFLASEMMLFGGLFTLVFAYRVHHPAAAAEAAQHLRLWLAAGNTAILLTSSLCVALAVTFARAGAARATTLWIAAAAALGLVFLALKGWEYRLDYQDGLMPGLGPPSPVAGKPAALFIDLYFVATVLHAIHMTVGLALLARAGIGAARGWIRLPGQAVVVEMTGLYWHFVDVVWVFLFPIFYLARG